MIDFLQPYTHGKEYNKGYNAAIDDYVKMAKEIKHRENVLTDIDLDYIAEQLKRGTNNDNSNSI